MRIRMRVTVTGTFHNIDGGVQAGQIVDVDEASAKRYINMWPQPLAEPVDESVEENAVLDTPAETAVVTPRRGRGRPKKQPEWHDEDAPGWKDANPEN